MAAAGGGHVEGRRHSPHETPKCRDMDWMMSLTYRLNHLQILMPTDFSFVVKD